jgi:transposase
LFSSGRPHALPALVSTAKAVFSNAAIVVDRFHFFWHLNKAVDNQRKQLCRVFKENDEFKYIKWALLKNKSDLTSEERKKLARAFAIAPELGHIYNHKEELRAIFEQNLTKEEAEIQINQWLENAQSLNNKYLNSFLKTFYNWKNYVLNYFKYRFITSIIEGINNSIKTIKRMCFGFRNFENFRYRIMLNFI